MLKNHDLKTFFLLDAFADAFFNNSDGFLSISGPSEPLKSWFSHGKYCNFEKITFFPPGGAPEAFFKNSGSILGDLGPQNRSRKLAKPSWSKSFEGVVFKRLWNQPGPTQSHSGPEVSDCPSGSL